ncbi:MAG: hypothetical protein AB1488_07100 [Nitrospirota bacterium]
MNTKLTLSMDEKLIKKEVIEPTVLSEISSILPPKADNKRLIKGYKRYIERKYI